VFAGGVGKGKSVQATIIHPVKVKGMLDLK